MLLKLWLLLLKLDAGMTLLEMILLDILLVQTWDYEQTASLMTGLYCWSCIFWVLFHLSQHSH